jgi:hypothetical protein
VSALRRLWSWLQLPVVVVVPEIHKAPAGYRMMGRDYSRGASLWMPIPICYPAAVARWLWSLSWKVFPATERDRALAKAYIQGKANVGERVKRAYARGREAGYGAGYRDAFHDAAVRLSERLAQEQSGGADSPPSSHGGDSAAEPKGS